MATDVELAWAAGFFDGEGCIYLRTSKREAGWQLLCNLTQTDRAPIEEFQHIVGGVGYISSRHASPKGNRRPCWCWQGASRNAGEVLVLLLPYLRVKKAQAVAALEFRATYPDANYRRWNRIPPEVFKERGRLARKVKALKLVGMAEEVA